MPAEQHPSAFVVGASNQAVEGISRTPVIKCSSCQMTVIGLAAVEATATPDPWLCQSCREALLDDG
jgi:hypothetical protein